MTMPVSVTSELSVTDLEPLALTRIVVTSMALFKPSSGAAVDLTE